MAMLGLGEMLILVLISGGAAFPISVPPLEEDPVLANVAPERCLFYTQWAGMAKPNPASENDAEKFLTDPEIRHTIAELETRMLAALKRLGEEAPGEPQRMLIRAGPRLAKTLLTRPMAGFLEDVVVEGKTPKPKAGLVISAGDKTTEVKETLERIQSTMLGGRVKKVDIGGSTFYQFQVGPSAPVVTWGVKGRYILAAVGEGVIEGMLRRAKTPAPQWLNDAKKRFVVKRRSTITYADLGSMIKKFASLAPDPESVAALLKSTGLANLKSYVSVAGLSEKRFVSHTAMDTQGELTGLLKALSQKPLTSSDVAHIPDDAAVAAVKRVDLAALYDVLLGVMDNVDPSFRTGIERAESEIGLELKKDVLAALGDVWSLYTHNASGGLISGWTVAASIRNREKLVEVERRLLELLRDGGPPGVAEMIKTEKFAGKEIRYLSIPEAGFPLAPAWCLTEKHLLMGMFPQAIRSQLSRGDSMGSITGLPQVAEVLQKQDGLLGLAYYDSKQVIHLLYPAIQMMMQAAPRLPGGEVNFDISLLPTAGALTRHLRPTIFTWRKTERGFETTLEQSFPGGSTGSVAPISVALLLPAVQAARAAARRTQGMNNLKQIALAMHNYHDAHGRLPGRYSLSKMGKPLLSWRVHILPYIEQQALYERFRLDEPWDSEHNKRLIPLMPVTYRAPSSKAPPGKTVYVVLAGKDTMFPKPGMDQNGRKQPGGLRFRAVRDGLSNTAMTVEASDKAAVTWTKPDDLDLDSPMMMDLMKTLMGLHPGGFSMGLGDGSVRFISQSIDRDVLKAMLTRAGGERFDIP